MLWDFSLGRTFSLLARTWPFIVLRMAVYAAIAVAFVAVTGTGAGLGWGIGAFGDAGFRTSSTFWGGAAGFGLVAIGLYFLREWVLYMVKAGHIAVLVEAMDDRPLPEGRSQIEHGRAVVAERFVEANVLFVIDQLVKAVIRAVTGLLGVISSVLPIPGIQGLARFVRMVLSVAIGLMDEVVLAYNIRIRSANPYESAQDGLVLYAQNAKAILKNAVWLAIFVYGLSLIMFLVFLAPAGAIVYFFPGDLSAIAILVAIVFAICFKAAVLEPFAIAALMQVYFAAIEGQAPREDWRQRLGETSKKFRALGEKARDFVGAPGNIGPDAVRR